MAKRKRKATKRKKGTYAGAKPGSGKNFAKLSKKVGKPLAAYIGRKKYGKKKFAKMAAKGRKRKGK